MPPAPRSGPEDRPGDERDHGLGAFMRRLVARGPAPEERLERLLAERRRELETHAQRFAAKLEDLERREQLLRDTRASVERLLRLGTADLEERELELTQLVGELAEREARIRAQEAELARRRAELGAVELKRAAVERRERALEEREAALGARERTAGHEARPETDAPSPHLLFVPGPAYRLVEATHPPLAPGDPVEVEGVPYLVVRTGPSPLPGDARSCAYLEPAAPSSGRSS
jgi:septal ring factor EnvC (AmiA/AmiB activator)